MATDYDCWRDTGEKVSHKYVLEIFQQNVQKVIKILLAVVPKMGKDDWTQTIKEAKVSGLIIVGCPV